MGYYDKEQLKEELSIEDIFSLVDVFGGEPEYTSFGFVAQTICHNLPNEGSRKLYYYENTKLFHCYTDCFPSSFDIFELIIKIKRIQAGESYDLYAAMDYVASYFGLSESSPPEMPLPDWKIFDRYNFKKVQSAAPVLKQLDEYDSSILNNFCYPIIKPWNDEGISQEVCGFNKIGYFPSSEQITIPHFDINNRLVGIRGRSLVKLDAERFGKYRPLIINNKVYSHPLSANLYNINNSKDNIRKSKTAIVFESEKSCLMMQSYFGHESDISVAVCGSSLSAPQVDILRSLGVKDLIIGFDRQFQEIGDNEFKKLKAKLLSINIKFNKYMNVSFIFDKHKITPYKASPIDCGPVIFQELLKNRLITGDF